MTDYKNVSIKKRLFIIRRTLPNVSKTARYFYFADDGLIDRNADVIIDRNDDVIVCRHSVYGYPRTVSIKKRDFIVRAKVG